MSEQAIDRTRLPIRRPPFAGVTKKTLEGSEPGLEPGGTGRAAGGRAERAARAHRRRRLRQSEHVRRPDRHAELHPHGGGGAALQPLPRDRGLLADARGHAHRPQPASRRVRPRGRVLRALPGLQRHDPARLRDAAADPAGERLHDLGDRQVAPDAGRPAGLERAVQPLADRARLRLLLGLPGRRGGPVRPAHHREPEGPGRPGGQGRQALLLPGRHGREGDRLAPPRARGAAATPRGSCTTRPAAATRRTRCRASGRTSTRASSTRAGTSSASETLARQKELGRRPAGHGAARERRVPEVGLAERDGEAPVRAPDGDLRRLLGERRLERRPRPRRDRGDGRARQHARDLDLGRQRREHGGNAHRARSTS